MKEPRNPDPEKTVNPGEANGSRNQSRAGDAGNAGNAKDVNTTAEFKGRWTQRLLRMEQWQEWLPAAEEVARCHRKTRRLDVGMVSFGVIALLFVWGEFFYTKAGAIYGPRMTMLALALTALDLAMVAFLYVNVLARQPAVREYIAGLRRYYLAGYDLYDIFAKRLFCRLDTYAEVGFCYETAVLGMMAMRNNFTSRLVIVETRKEGHHAFVEFRAMGLWWAIDPTWQRAIVRWCPTHHCNVKPARILRVIPHQEFWQFPVAREIEVCMRQRETSYVFLDLLYLCVQTGQMPKLVCEANGIQSLRHDGRRWNYQLISTIRRDRPITERMIAQYMARPRRMMPKRKAYRRAATFDRTLRKATAEVIETCERLEADGYCGAKITIRMRPPRCYEIVVEDLVRADAMA